MTGGWTVGRLRPTSDGGAGQFEWMLTGPYTTITFKRGRADDLELAKAALLDSWREWQSWAAIKDADA